MFKVRKTPCSFNKTVYEEDRDSFNCQSSINVYHCIQNERNRSGEICVQPVWVQPNYCPEYNTGANTLDTVPCNVSTGSCPDVLFLSNEVYKYPVCLNKTFTDSKDISKENTSSTTGIYIGIAVSLLIVTALVCIIVFCFRRKRQHRREDEEMSLLDEEEPFYKTSAYHEGLTFLGNGGKILCLEGRWGSGKTSTAKQVYMAVTKSTPIIISDLLTFDASKHYKPIIMSQAFLKGKTHEEVEHFREKIRIYFKNISFSKKSLKVFIILILKENEDREVVSEFVKSFVTQEKDIKFIDLSKSLTRGDRTQILSSQFERFCPNKDFSKVENLAIKGNDNSLGYPEICALFCRCSHFQTVGPLIFCNQPLRYLKLYLENMHNSDDKEKFLMLVYMSLNRTEINISNQNDMLSGILESCNCTSVATSKETKGETEQKELSGIESIGERSNIEQGSSFRNQIKSKKHYMRKGYITSLIPKEFLIIDRLQHDVIKRMALIVFGTHHFDKLLELSKPEELKEWVIEKQFVDLLGDIKPVLEIDREQWRQFKAKLSL